MAKTKNINELQPYLVVKQIKGHSRNTGRPYTQITMIGIKDRLEYTTYIEEGMRNYKNWEHIVAYPERTFILSNVKTKDFGEGLLDADSRPVIEHSSLPENAEEILKPVEDFWAEEDARQAKRVSANTFNQLFGDEE